MAAFAPGTETRLLSLIEFSLALEKDEALSLQVLLGVATPSVDVFCLIKVLLWKCVRGLVRQAVALSMRFLSFL